VSDYRPWREVRDEAARLRAAHDAGTCPGTPHRGHASSDASCPLERPDLKLLAAERLTDPRDRYDPLADHTDAAGVLHRYRHVTDPGPAGRLGWYHPAGVTCGDTTCPGNDELLERLDVTSTNVVETRLVEADLGARYRYGHTYEATTGDGVRVRLVPHRVRVFYRRPRPDACPLASDPWVVTQVMVIGRNLTRLVRWDAHARFCRLDAHHVCGYPRPSERQRSFTDLATAPAWVGDVVRALAVARPPTTDEEHL